MSFGIYWEPVKPVWGRMLPQALKYVLADKYFESDGTTRGTAILGPGNCEYLQGIAHATNSREVREGAERLIKAIREHGTVRVWIGESDD